MARKLPTTLDVLLKGLKARKNNAAVLADVLASHPHSKMTRATVNWYRNRYRGEGMKIPSEHELKG